MIVVDTSVMVRLVVGGPDGASAARLLLRDPEWAAPPVLLSELRNVLLGFVRQGSLILNQAKAMCDDAARVLGPRIFTVSSDRALDAALECGVAASDAEFVVLARELGVRLATADRSILTAARHIAVWTDAARW